MERVGGEQGLAATFSIQILLIFGKFKLLYKQYSVIPGAQTWPFCYFQYALSISGIF